MCTNSDIDIFFNIRRLLGILMIIVGELVSLIPISHATKSNKQLLL